MGNGDYTIFVSKNHKFKYYDEKKVAKINSGDTGKSFEFVQPTKKVDMKFPEFTKRLKEWKRGDERYIFANIGIRHTIYSHIIS